MKTLLLEVGCEEIPAGYIEPALKAMSESLTKKLGEARIDFGGVRVFGTPKRLAIEIKAVADSQKAMTTEVTGPPKSVGYDENGNPTMAAQKFAEKLGIAVEDIQTKETKKGVYLCGVKTEETLETGKILETILPETILALPFPKTMRWADLDISFARPIQSVLALLGTDIIPFTVGDIASGRETYGHRFMKPGRISVQVPEDYPGVLRDAFVIADIGERREMVRTTVEAAAKEAGGRVLQDDELLDTVTNLVEYPVPVVGRFDDEFLEVPEEVLITAMREHQKYFAVVDGSDRLMPCFIAVNNTRAKDMDVVAKGHEKVIRARLSDAQFFYRTDLNVSVDDRLEKLKSVLFQARLGSVYEKVLRIKGNTEYIAELAGADDSLKTSALRTAGICKADLVSHMVVEFTKLQGLMGRVYAAKAGEDPVVASAIEEHYRPTHSGGVLPETDAGAFVSIADKTDSICGCFSVGLVPTGAADPYALRRQSIGIIQIMKAKGFSFSLKALLEKGVSHFSELAEAGVKTVEVSVYNFIKDRISHILFEDGFSKDVIASVVEVSIDNIPDVWKRVDALEKMKNRPDFEPLAAAFKRVVNIIKKAELPESTAVDTALFEGSDESELFEAFTGLKQKVDEKLGSGRFEEALIDIASIRDTVDAFFDNVMVMAEDEKIRNNRLALLASVASLFSDFADFSKISV